MRTPMVGRLAAILLVLGFAACKSVGTIGYPVEFIDTHAPDHVWITQADKSVTEVYGAKVNGDTLVGFVKGTGEYVEIPVSKIQLMKAPQFSPMKTALLAGSVAIGTALIVSSIQGTATNCSGFAPGAANNGLIAPCGTIYGKPN